MTLEGKRILVTGVSRGIGRAIALRCVAEGARVAGVYGSDDDAARSLAAACEALGPPPLLLRGDVADRAFAEAAVRRAGETLGGLDALVNNAGIARDGFLMQMTDAAWDAVLGVNFGGTLAFTHAALPWLVRSGGGAVVSVISVTGVLGRAAQANYAASKGAILGLMRALARRHGPDGVRFPLVAPGMISTTMLDAVPPDKVENFVRHTAAGRLGTPDEVARVVAFLCSDAASYVTSTALRLDGGFLR